MGINLIIAATDGDWFEMLRRQPDLGEVNFWAPSAANFREPDTFFYRARNRKDTLLNVMELFDVGSN